MLSAPNMITTKINTNILGMFLKMSNTVFTDHKYTYLDLFAYIGASRRKTQNLMQIVEVLWIILTKTNFFRITFTPSDPNKRMCRVKYSLNVLTTLKKVWLSNQSASDVIWTGCLLRHARCFVFHWVQRCRLCIGVWCNRTKTSQV